MRAAVGWLPGRWSNRCCGWRARLRMPKLLVVNKFGKQESEGKGMAGSIADAIGRGIPVLVGVNGLNLPAFLEFTDGVTQELTPDAARIADWCLAAMAETGAHQSPARQPGSPPASSRHIRRLPPLGRGAGPAFVPHHGSDPRRAAYETSGVGHGARVPPARRPTPGRPR